MTQSVVDKTAVAGSYPLILGANANTGFSRTVTGTLTLKKQQTARRPDGRASSRDSTRRHLHPRESPPDRCHVRPGHE